MSDILLIVAWPDLFGIQPPSPALLAQALRRQACLRHEDFAGYVWAPAGTTSEPGPDFSQWGFRPLDAELSGSAAAALARQHPHISHTLLVMDAGRAADLTPTLRDAGHTVEVWSPHPAAGRPEVMPLQDMLHLATAQPVTLLADWPRLLAAARALPAAPSPQHLRDRLIRSAELVGSLVSARLYAGWREGPFLDLAGAHRERPLPEFDFRAQGNPTESLRQDLDTLLDRTSPPFTYILAAEGGWLRDVIRRAHERGIRVLLWSFNESNLPVELQAEADGTANLAALFGTETSARPLAPRPYVAPVDPEGPRASAPTPQPPHASARLTSWTRLLYHSECILRENGASRMPLRKLAAALAEREEFGPSASNATMWLNRARAEGLLLIDSEAQREDPAVRVALCRPNPEHPLARAALEVPDRCLRLLHQMLQKIPWVSFKLLRNVLLREQWLGGPPFRLDEASVDEWLNFLIYDGAIRMTKEPNLVNPEYPVTALRLNEQHPLSSGVAADATESTRLAAERAILAVDHFLIRNRKPWMAMSALRRSLNGLGRDELQNVLQELQSVGALVTESYPNPQREHYTTGCQLRVEVPLVSGVLATRNTFVRVAQEQHRSQSWVPLSQLDEELRTGAYAPSTPAHCLAWILLLRDEGILELDHEGLLPSDPWQTVSCRLNVSDAVVRTVVAADERRPEQVAPVFRPPSRTGFKIQGSGFSVERVDR